MSEGVVENVELKQADLAGLLPAFVEAKETASRATRKVNDLTAIFKKWLLAHGEDAIWVESADGVLEARLQNRSGPESYDVTSMPPELVLQLHQAGALNVDVQMIKALTGRAILPDDIKPYRIPGAESVALIAGRVK